MIGWVVRVIDNQGNVFYANKHGGNAVYVMDLNRAIVFANEATAEKHKQIFPASLDRSLVQVSKTFAGWRLWS